MLLIDIKGSKLVLLLDSVLLIDTKGSVLVLLLDSVLLILDTKGSVLVLLLDSVLLIDNKGPSIFILTVPRWYFCCGSLLFLLSAFILWFSYYVNDIFCKF